MFFLYWNTIKDNLLLFNFNSIFRALEILELMLKKEFNDRVAVSLAFNFLGMASLSIIQI